MTKKDFRMRPSSSLCLPILLLHFMNLQAHFAFTCSPPQGVVLAMPGRPNIVCFLFLSFLVYISHLTLLSNSYQIYLILYPHSYCHSLGDKSWCISKW